MRQYWMNRNWEGSQRETYQVPVGKDNTKWSATGMANALFHDKVHNETESDNWAEALFVLLVPGSLSS